MTRFVVLVESDGDAYAGESWVEAIAAATPDSNTVFVDACIVDAPDAGAARLLHQRAGCRLQTLAPPQRWNVRRFDVWGNPEDGYDVNDVVSVGAAWISADMTAADVLGVIEASEGIEVSWTDDGYIGLANADDGKPVGDIVAAEDRT